MNFSNIVLDCHKTNKNTHLIYNYSTKKFVSWVANIIYFIIFCFNYYFAMYFFHSLSAHFTVSKYDEISRTQDTDLVST